MIGTLKKTRLFWLLFVGVASLGLLTSPAMALQSVPTAEEVAALVEAGEISEDDAGIHEEYVEMVEGHGFHAYAFDFFVTSMLWTVIAAAMVFIMHLGFAMLETGLTQQKNAVNVMFKNVFIISAGIVTYALIGFNTHYPADWIIPNVLGFGGWIGDLNVDATFGYGGVGLAMTAFGDFIFQAMFAATGATIVSGAVAERVKLPSFMIFVVVFVAIAYPVIGSWHWGEGWLYAMDFYDFAGSSVVHAFGGFGALACVMVLGPRAGKYLAGGKIRPIPAHSFPLATIGVFLLWFGWFGFNGGSVLSAEPADLGLVFTTTALAASSGAIVSILVSWTVIKKPDLSMALNGVLAGLVGITAGADAVGPGSAIIMGGIAGAIVVFSILFFDKIKIDDPVGAISVHGVCGIWGTVAVGIFASEVSFFVQLIGTLAVSAAAFVSAFIIFSIIKAVMGVRVSSDEEAEGLDLGEHGQEAYADFQMKTR